MGHCEGRWRRVGRSFWMGLALWGVTAVSARAEGPRTAGWVSNEALIYAEIRQPGALLDQLRSDQVQDLLQAVPGYSKALKQPNYRQFLAVVNLVADALGTTWDEGLRELTGGGIVLAVEGKDKPERIYLILNPKNKELLQKTHDKILELARQDAAGKGKPDPVKEGDYRGIKGYQVSPQEAHAIVEDTLVIANGKEALQAIIDRVKDPEAFTTPITSDDTWKARHEALDPETTAWAFARLDRLRAIDPKRFRAEGTPNAALTFFFGPWVEAARKSNWVSLGLVWNESKLGASLDLPVPPDGLSDALKQYLPGEGQGASGLIKPPGTILSVSLWRNLSAIWDVRDQLLPPEALQGLAQLDTFAGQFFGGRDFGSGVLGALGNDWRFVIVNQDYEGMNPVPDVKLPGFALIVGLKPEDEEFSVRLKAAFQSFVGLANLGAAQTKAPPLMLGSESFEGVTISTAKYLPPTESARTPGEPIPQRYNFSPSAVQLDDHFVLSSNAALARSLVKALKNPAQPSDATLFAEADGQALARLVEVNRDRMVMQNMIEKGNDKAGAAAEIDLIPRLLRYLGHGQLRLQDRADGSRLTIDFRLGTP